MYMIYTTRYNVLHIIITWYNITLLQIYNIYNIIPYKYSIYNFVPFLFPTYFNITNISPWFILDNLLAWELLSQRDICKSRNYMYGHITRMLSGCEILASSQAKEEQSIIFPWEGPRFITGTYLQVLEAEVAPSTSFTKSLEQYICPPPSLAFYLYERNLEIAFRIPEFFLGGSQDSQAGFPDFPTHTAHRSWLFSEVCFLYMFGSSGDWGRGSLVSRGLGAEVKDDRGKMLPKPHARLHFLGSSLIPKDFSQETLGIKCNLVLETRPKQ